MKKLALAIGLSLIGGIMTAHADTATIKTSMGTIVCNLRPDLAPNTVKRFEALAEQGFYKGVIFHRVIPNFMIQGGDPTGTGMGGSGEKLKAEFSKVPFDKAGILAMARASDPNSADSQFFITVAPATHLNGQYTIFGEVKSGQEVADKISNVKRDSSDRPLTPVVIESITIQK